MREKIRHRFTIKQKVTVFILVASFVVGFIGLGLIYWSEYNLLRQNISRDYITMARLLSIDINRIIAREIKSTEVFMDSSDRISKVEEYNLKYEGMSDERKEAYFKNMDEKWLKASDNDPLIMEYTESPVGRRLREIAQDDPSFAEIFMTDKYGGLVAASAKTSDFYQADEEWWQKSFNHGKGDIFVDRIGFDQSSKAVSIALAVPIKNKLKEVIGICKNVLEINRLFSPLESFSLGKSGHVELMDKEGNLIYYPGIKAMTKKFPDKVARIIASQNSGFFLSSDIDELHKEKIAISYFKIQDPELLKSGIDWWLCIVQDADEVFAPLQGLIFKFMPVALAMTLIIILLGFYFSLFLVKPIVKLRNFAEKVARGNLEDRIEIKTGDEIEDLAGSFNSMLESLKDNFTTIDRLNDEIALRKRTEESLQKSEEKYRALFTESRDAVMILLPDKGFISGNPAAIKMFVCRDEADFKTRSPEELSPKYQPDGVLSSDKAREMIDLALKQGSNLFEWVHKRLDGTEFNAIVLLSRFKLEGNFLLQATVRDITEQKRAEAALQESEEWFSTALNSIGDAVITTDTKGKITFINPIAQDLTGWKQDEAIGQHIDDVFVIKKEDSGEKADNPVLKVLGNGLIAKLANHTVLISKSGNQYSIDDSAAPIIAMNSKDILGVVLVFRDITERNNRERELSQLSIAVEQSPVCVVITDMKGNMQYVNPKFINLTGYNREEVMGKNPRILKSGEQSEEFYKNLWNTITAGKEWRGEFHNKKKSGELYWENASISPIRNKEGVITNFIAVKEDVTERKRLERLKDDFVSTISHELRTPLTAIKEGINIVSDGSAGTINDEQQEFLGIAKRNVDRLARLINEVLDFQKFESGKMTLNIVENDIIQVCNEVRESMVQLASGKGLELFFESEEGLPKIKFDRDKITQVLTNLINNAIKFTERGRITVSVKSGNNFIKVSVRDSGPGIKEEDIVRLFQKFVQLGKISDRKTGGTGLGLVISKDIIDAHKGKIWVESKLGKGSVFSFILPIEERRRAL